MINMELLNEIKCSYTWQIEEMIKAIDGIDYWKDDFLSYTGPAGNILDKVKHELSNIIYSNTYSGLDEYYIALALFLRETTYWFADEIMHMANNIACPMNILNGYKMYLDYFFYRTEKQEIMQYTTIEELRENLFEKYKFNRNIRDNNENNIKVLKLLTLIDEYEQIIDENERLRTSPPQPQTNFNLGEQK